MPKSCIKLQPTLEHYNILQNNSKLYMAMKNIREHYIALNSEEVTYRLKTLLMKGPIFGTWYILT